MMDTNQDQLKKEVSRQIQNDINYMVSQIRKHSSPKILTSLYGELETLAEYVGTVDLDVEFPELYVFEPEKFDRIYNAYYKKLIRHYESLFRTNKEIAYNVNTMFNENGSSNHTDKFRIKVNSWELAKDFFQSYDREILEYYKSEIKKKNYFEWVIEPGTLGITMNLDSCDKSYVMISNSLEENILKASVIVHETIHSYIANLEKNKTYEEEDRERLNAIHEVYPIFAQLLFVDLLRKVRFKEKDILTLDRFFKGCLRDFSDSFSSDLYSFESFADPKVVSEYYLNEGELESLENAIEMSEFLKDLNVDVTPDDLIENPSMIQLDYGDEETALASTLTNLIESDEYFYGYYLAYFFYYNYKMDPKKTKEAITRFSLDAKRKSKIELLDGYGLGLDRLKEPKNIKKLIYTKDYYK